MRFTNDSFKVKLIGGLRFIIAKIVYGNAFNNRGISLIGRKCDLIIKKKGKLTFGQKVILSGYNQIIALGELEIGSQVTINEYSRIVSHEKIRIGSNVTIAKFVSILDHDHGYQFYDNNLQLNGYESDPIIIGNNVWIGDKTSILKGVEIGNNVIIGANSLVNKSIPSNHIAAGNPCKIIKKIE